MLAKRIVYERTKLEKALAKTTIESYVISEDCQEIIIKFYGPRGTRYEQDLYKLKFVLGEGYPFKKAQAFFIDLAPQHPFYAFDGDDAGRAKRTTNLANTDFGLFYDGYSPRITTVDYVKEIQKSLTPDGEQEMKSFMKGGNHIF